MRLNSKQIQTFTGWLNEQGADILAPTSEYELLRFRCRHGTGVIYTGRRGQSTNGAIVDDAIRCWQKQRPWDGKGERTSAGGKSLKPKLLLRDGPACFYCGEEFEPAELTVEHLLSRAHGGPNRLTNTVLACRPCNEAVGCMTLPEKVRWRDEKRSEVA